MDIPTHKIVNGQRVELAQAEKDAQIAEWQAGEATQAIIDGERQKIRAAQSSIASEDFAQLRDAIAALPNSATKQILIAMARILWRLAVAQSLSRQFEG